jgi:hypothetical protein
LSSGAGQRNDRTTCNVASWRWAIDGHSGESDDEKKKKKVERLQHELHGENQTKILDRDGMASDNIGVVWIGDNVKRSRQPAAFVRPFEAAKVVKRRQKLLPAGTAGRGAKSSQTMK